MSNYDYGDEDDTDPPMTLIMNEDEIKRANWDHIAATEGKYREATVDGHAEILFRLLHYKGQYWRAAAVRLAMQAEELCCVDIVQAELGILEHHQRTAGKGVMR